jgi:hypothetical protein
LQKQTPGGRFENKVKTKYTFIFYEMQQRNTVKETRWGRFAVFGPQEKGPHPAEFAFSEPSTYATTKGCTIPYRIFCSAG